MVITDDTAHMRGEAGFDAFAANCVGLIAGCPVGANPRQWVTDLLAQAGQAPIPSSEPGETRTATPGVVMTAVQAALYDTASWPQLAPPAHSCFGVSERTRSAGMASSSPSAERRRVPDAAWDPGRGFRSWLQKLELRHVPNFDPRAAVTTVHVSCVVYLFL